MNKIGSFLKLGLLFSLSLALFGCATLSYVGDDYVSNNLQTVKTDEDLVFNVYKKSDNNANVKIGITRTSVPEILALYMQIENLSYETPYTFKVEDLEVYDTERRLQFITTNNYLNIWQTQEASSMSSIGTLGSTITTMTGINANYNDYNQAIMQNNAEQTNQSSFKRIDETGNQILKHTIRVSSVISPRKSQYYYFFFEDSGKFPLKIKYKNLEYQFNL